MIAEPELAFRLQPTSPALAVCVNFGIFAGRDATPAEIDELALLLRPEIGELSIISEARHEIGLHSEASLHQVRIEVASANLPSGADARDEIGDLIVRTAIFWARMCAAERHADL